MIKYILTLLVILGTFSCAQNMGPIDRTVSGRIDKSIFNAADEWYMRTTIIDVPFNTGFSFIGNQGSTELVRWRITEDYLYAQRAHDWIDGSEEEGYIKDGEYYYGAPVAIYAIKSHFDVQKQYNPSTGEETNVTIENTSDRPWNERTYMRVDWSKNLVKDLRFGSVSRIKTNPLSYYVPETELDNPERLDVADDHINIVGMIFSEPETNYIWEYPISCYLITDSFNFVKDPMNECLGQKMKYRTSFLKKSTNNKYQATQYDDNKFNKFGFFRTDRFKYDRWRSFSREKELHLINKWNLCKADRDDQDLKTCETRKIVYYLNENFPEELKEEAQKVALTWNRVLKSTVALAKRKNVDFHEEVLTHDDDYFANIENSKLKKYLEDEDDIFILCPNNPVQDDDPEECGEAGLNPQIGDLRYSMIYWVANPQKSSPLGYGPSAEDTETGEIFQANAFVYGNGIETYVTYIMDIIDLLNEDVSVDDYTSGKYLQDYLASKEYSVAPKSLGKIKIDGIRAKFDRISGFLNNSNFSSLTSNSDKLKQLKGTPVEELLSSNQIKKDVFMGQEKSAIDFFSEDRISKIEELKTKLAENTIMMSNFNDQTMIAWAIKLKNKYCVETVGTCTDAEKEKIALDIKKHQFFSVTLHEVGHTLGLRHNYHSSSDAINFFDQYWNLKKADASKIHKHFTPEYENMPSNDSIEAGLRENQYTSIMDYLMRPNSSLKGLGMYDYAAIHYGYGNQVMVFDGDGYNKDFYNNVRSGDYHYTSLPYLLKNANDCNNGENTENCSQDEAEVLSNLRSRKWVQLDKQEVGKACGDAKACESGVCNKFGHCVECLENSDCETGFCSSDNVCLENVEVPLAFCSDELVGRDWRCYRFSEGADAFEKAKAKSDLYQTFYFMRNFRRGKAFFGLNYGSYGNRVAGTLYYLDRMLKYSAYESYIKRKDANFVEKSGLGQHFLMGQKVIMNTFAAIMQTTGPGEYAKVNDEYRFNYIHTDFSTKKDHNSIIYLKPGMAVKYETNFYDPSLGYYYYYKPIVHGVLLDKLYALVFMSNSFFLPTGKSFSGYYKKYAVSLYTLFPAEFQKIIASIYAEDAQSFAPTIVEENGEKVVKYTPAVFYNDSEKTIYDNTPRTQIVAGKESLTQYTIRLYAGLTIPAFLNETWLNNSVRNSGYVGVKGYGDDYEPDWDNLVEGVDYIQVTEPKTRRTYYAMKYNNYDDLNAENDYNLGWKLIEDTIEMAKKVKNGEESDYQLGSAFDKMDVLRTFYHYNRGFY